MRKIVLAIFLLATSLTSEVLAQVNPFADGTPSPVAVLDLQATDSGILIPRITQASRTAIEVSSRPDGLLVYQTNLQIGFWYYRAAAPRGWTYLGNDNLGNHIVTQTLDLASNSTINLATMTFATNGTPSIITNASDLYAFIGINSRGTIIATTTRGDNLGDHKATQTLDINVKPITNLATLTFAKNATPSLDKLPFRILGLNADGDVVATSTVGRDDLGNHIATQNLNMASKSIFNLATVTYATNGTPSLVNTSAIKRYLGINAAGTVVATNSLEADNLGNHIATRDLDMGTHSIINSGTFTFSTAIGASPTLVNTSSIARYLGINNQGTIVATSTIQGDNLGNHIATTTLDIKSNAIAQLGTLTFALNRLPKLVANPSGISYLGINEQGTVVATDTLFGDNLGNHMATRTLNMASHSMINLATVSFASTSSPSLVQGTQISLFLALDGDGNVVATNTIDGDNLGNHRATTTLDMATNGISNLGTVTFSSTASPVIVNISKIDRFLGITSSGRLVGTSSIAGDNLGDHIATTNLNLSTNSIIHAATITFATNGTPVLVNQSELNRFLAINPQGKIVATNTLDNLGNHRATTTLDLDSNSILHLGTVTFSLTASPAIVDLTRIRRFLGMNSQGTLVATNTIERDNLGNHIATQILDMNEQQIINLATTTFSTSNLPAMIAQDKVERILGITKEGTIVATSTVADNLGSHIATMTLDLSTNSIINLGTVTFAKNATPSTTNSSDIFRYLGVNGDGTIVATSTIEGDNLGNHTATTTLDMATNAIVNAATITFSSTASPSLANTSQIIRYLGLKSDGELVGTSTIIGDNLGNHIATTTLDLSTNSIINLGTVTFASNAIPATDSGLIVRYLGLNKSGTVVGTTTLTGDNLGNHIATRTLDIATHSIINLATTTFSTARGASPTLINGPHIDRYLVMSKKFALAATSTIEGDNLGDHIAIQTLDMATHAIINLATTTFSTARGASPTLINGHHIDRYLGIAPDGTIVGTSTLDNLGNHIATTTLQMGTHSIAFGERTLGMSFAEAGTVTIQATTIIQNDMEVFATARATKFTNVSDRRIKTSITEVDNALPKLLKLNPVTYSFTKDYRNMTGVDEDKQYGFIAQEVAKIFPELVSIQPKRVGGKLIKDFHTMNYVELTSIIVSSVQKLTQENRKLKDTVRELESQIQVLEAQNSRIEKLESMVKILLRKQKNNSTSESPVYSEDKK